MKTKVLCWFPTSSYTNNDIINLLLCYQIAPLLDSSYSKAIWEAEGRPETMRNWTFGEETKQLPYKDELVSAYGMSVGEVKNELKYVPDLVCGETSTETIQQLVDAGCKSITYTCYGWHLFRIAGLNIRMPFTSQLNTWKYLEKKYNYETVEFSDGTYWTGKKEQPLFAFCWIMLDQTKSFKKLISWCITHNKTIGLVAPDNKKNNPEWVKEHLTEFIKQYKEVVK